MESASWASLEREARGPGIPDGPIQYLAIYPKNLQFWRFFLFPGEGEGARGGLVTENS